MKKQGDLYLIPNTIGEENVERSLATHNFSVVASLQHFAVENQKSARKFIRKVVPDVVQADLKLYDLDKNSKAADLAPMIQLLKNGVSVGIISEAGMPGIADPGALLVAAAHRNSVRVVPLIGASSIFLALAASGFNGQHFTFHGYLPIDRHERRKSIQHLYSDSQRKNSAEIFMETPYRNNQLMEELLKTLPNDCLLCVACNIAQADEKILTLPIHIWKKTAYDLHKKPTIFILQATEQFLT
ncbi:MAG: SAM-dependent methyltransferase [Weeksellaceae bacterium]|nr:SAM-dependent methyltransferase [Weeksellaceae bacterium]